MRREQALVGLVDSDPETKLRAIRVLGEVGLMADVSQLRAFLTSSEISPWLRSGALNSIERIERRAHGITPPEEPLEERYIEDAARSRAVQDVTTRLVHELRTIVGTVRLAASAEIEDAPNSRTLKGIERLQRFLEAIETLGMVATAPTIQEFDLATLIEDEVNNLRNVPELGWEPGVIETIGPTPFLASSDARLLVVVVSNALRNAREAIGPSPSAGDIVVTWGQTDRDVWFSILNRALKIPPNLDRLWSKSASQSMS